MMRALLALVCLVAFWGQAAVTPLPGATSQTALAGDVFPNPIRLLVTDAADSPVPGATVQWGFPPIGYSRFLIREPSPCERNGPFSIDLVCRVTAGADGIAQIDGLYGTTAGFHELSVNAGFNGTYLGAALLQFRVEPRQPPLQVLPVSGEGRRFVIGTISDERFVVRVLTAEGQPIPSAKVEFTPRGNTQTHRGFLVDGQTWVESDADGYAISPPLFAGWVPGELAVQATVQDGEAAAALSTRFNFTVTNARGELDLDLTNMWWAGPLENGWGMSVVKHGRQAFNVLFVYDTAGKPTWYVQPGGTFLDSDAWAFVGPVYSPRSTPWFAYDASRFVVGPRVGYLNTGFFGPERARLSFRLESPAQPTTMKSLVIQDFTGETPSPLRGVADMWWGGPEQNGWGVAILEQFGGLFAVWFTYDAEGKPTWLVMPGGAWRDATTYSGTMYRTSGAPWVGREYDASQLRVGAVGPYALKFLDTNRAILEISVDGVARSLPITRQPF